MSSSASLSTRIALQQQRIELLHENDNEFTYALADYCRFITRDAGATKLVVEEHEWTERHMDRLQVLRDMMMLMNELYDSSEEGDQIQIYIQWVTDLIREKFNAITADEAEAAASNPDNGAAYGDSDPYGQESGTYYDDDPSRRVIVAVSDFWFNELCSHLVAENPDFASSLRFLVEFALDPHGVELPLPQSTSDGSGNSSTAASSSSSSSSSETTKKDSSKGGSRKKRNSSKHQSTKSKPDSTLSKSALCGLLTQFRKILQTSMIFMDEAGVDDANSAVHLIMNFVEEVGRGEILRKKKHARASGGSAAARVFTKLATMPGTKKEGFRFKRSHSGKNVLPKGPRPCASGEVAAKVQTNDLGRSLLNFLSGPGSSNEGDERSTRKVAKSSNTDAHARKRELHSSKRAPKSEKRSDAGSVGFNESAPGFLEEPVALGTAGSVPRGVLRRILNFLTAPEAVHRSILSRSLRPEFLTGRECLDLSGRRVPGKAFAQLVAASAPTLRRLNLYCAQIGGDVIRALCVQPLPRMQHFDLFGANSGGDGASFFSHDGDESGVFDVARVVRQCLAMPALRSLDLRWNRLTMQQVLSIVQALQGCRKLRHINFKFNAVSRKVLRDMEQRMPHLPFTFA
eukprot:INCI2935.1.p1 GENE.INCI2935.1~~INCI2935.1.p1  ORF type:complete len:629 (+),score=121.75 INCI2935.1:274-2160(+)